MVRFGLTRPEVGQTSGETAIEIYSTRAKSKEDTVKETLFAAESRKAKDFIDDRLVIRSKSLDAILHKNASPFDFIRK